MMWVLFGVLAIITASLNVLWTAGKKDARWFRFLSMSFTALTLAAEYSVVKRWVLSADYSAIEDVVPTMSKILWFLTILSIAINSISLFVEPSTKEK